MEELDPNINYDVFDSEEESDFYQFSPTLTDLSSFNGQDEADYEYYFDDGQPIEYTDIFSDLDFSDYSGKYKPNMRRAMSKLRSKPVVTRKRRRRKKRPIMDVKRGRKNVDVTHTHKKIHGKGQEKVLIPDDRKVIIEGVNSFILDNSQAATSVKEMGYYKGKKLKELVLTFNNQGPLNFDVELFNPSMPLDFLQSTGLNINDQVQVAGGGFVDYTDVLFNLLANPTRLYKAKFTLAGPLLANQINQPLIVSNKEITGKEKVAPFQMQLSIDIDQQQNNFDLEETLNRPFIPDGMDIITYRVLPGMSVTFGFYYSQVSLKKFFYKDAYNAKGLL